MINVRSIFEHIRAEHEQRPILQASVLSVGFMLMLAEFNPYIYLGFVILLVALVQYYPLSSDHTEVLLFATLPVIGAIANFHSRCLTYSSIVLFLLCRSFAIHGKLQPRHALLYFLVIASWAIHYTEENSIIYGGGIMHGFMHPLSFIMFTRKQKWIRLGVFVIPTIWALNNLFLYKQFFVAFWDVEIFLVYFFWWIGKNKETVVKRIFMISLPLNTFAQMYWDVCPKKGELLYLIKDFVESHFGTLGW